ncbi:hypothetical protein KBC59_01310 [Patescibacteria group bacterium]|jgi:hypothetical protein|nr:hypothetical protein [Patescibacteria group bacterium]
MKLSITGTPSAVRHIDLARREPFSHLPEGLRSFIKIGLLCVQAEQEYLRNQVPAPTQSGVFPAVHATPHKRAA